MVEVRDSIKYTHRVESKVYRNEELARWIEEHFEEGLPRTMAWTLAFKIGEMYPEVKDKIRGDLIDSDIQEESEWA